MKQGTGVTHIVPMGGRKTPTGGNYSPGAVSQIGEALGNHATDSVRVLHGASAPMYAGKKAFMAPEDMSCTHHHSGSQGKR